MELEALKNGWNNISADLNRNEFDILSATMKKMTSPLAELKKKTKKQIKILPILFAFLIVMMVNQPEMKTNLLIWMALILLPLTTLYHYFNLRIINELEETDGSVKNDLQRKVNRLLKKSNIYLNLTRFIIILLMVLTELLLRSNKTALIPEIEILKSLTLPLRLLIYAAIIGVHYVLSRYTFNLYFGRYLNRLKVLLSDMQ